MKSKKNSNRRDFQGYALISIMVIGAFAVMFLMALSSTLLTISRAQSVEKQKALLLNALDSGLDYALQKINTDPYAFNDGQVYSLSSENFPGEELLGDDLKTKLQFSVKTINSSDWSTINSFAALNSSMEVSTGNILKTSIRTSSWKVLEMTASKGVFSKSVRAILEPHLFPASNFNGSSSDSVVNTTKKSIFTAPVFADGNIEFRESSTSLDGTMQTNSDFSVVSDKTLALEENSTLKGKNFIPSNSSANATITGGEAQLSGTHDGVNIQNPVPISSSTENVMPSPLNYSGKQLPTDGSSLSGQYSYSGDSPLSMSLNVSPDSTAQIFIDPSSSVDLNTSSIVYTGTTSSLNLQIYYGGANELKITLADGKPLNATVYAPNAVVTLSGQGNSASFDGALVGKKVVFDNIANIKLNSDVSDIASSAALSNGFIYREISEGPLKGAKFFQYEPVTWQETSTKLVP